MMQLKRPQNNSKNIFLLVSVGKPIHITNNLYETDLIITDLINIQHQSDVVDSQN